MKIKWSHASLSDIEEAKDYIAKENFEAAQDFVERVFSVVEDTLKEQPLMGRPGFVEGTRELVVTKSYIAVYTVEEGVINVLAVRHPPPHSEC